MCKSIKNLIIFGIGDFAQLAYYYFSNNSVYHVVGFTVESQYRGASELFGLPIFDYEEVENYYSPDKALMFVAVGYTKMNDNRARVFTAAKSKGYSLVNYVSSRACVYAEVSHLENIFIQENCIVQPFVKLSNNTILWSGSCLCHHTRVGRNTFVGACAVVAGRVEIGRNCFVGANSTIRDKILVADYTLVAAGSTLIQDTDAYGVYRGVPAKKANADSYSVTI